MKRCVILLMGGGGNSRKRDNLEDLYVDVFAFINKPSHSALSLFTSDVIWPVAVAFKAILFYTMSIWRCMWLKYWQNSYNYFFFHGARAPSGAGPPHYRGFTITLGRTVFTTDQLDAETYTLQHITLARDRHPCPRRDSNPPIPAREWPQTPTLNRAATGSVTLVYTYIKWMSGLTC